FAADEAEVAVNILQANAEEGARELAIDRAEEGAVPGIGAAFLEAIHPRSTGCGEFKKQAQLGHVVLSVPVGIKHVVLGGGREAAAQCASVATVYRVGDHTHP